MEKFYLFMLLIGVVNFTMSQTYLNLTDGSSLKLGSYFISDDSDYLDYSYFKKSGKIKNSRVEMTDVFSLNINGKDSIIYFPASDKEFSVVQMKEVVLGRNLALGNFKPYWAYASGLVVGFGAAILPIKTKYSMAFGLSIPVAYLTGMAFVKPGKSYVESKYPSQIGNEYFIYGYQNKAKKKIFRNTLLGTSVGIVVGVLIKYFILKKEGVEHFSKKNI